MYPLLEIKTVPIELQIKMTNATLEYSRGTAEMEIVRSDKGAVSVKSRPIQVQWDSFEQRSDPSSVATAKAITAAAQASQTAQLTNQTAAPQAAAPAAQMAAPATQMALSSGSGNRLDQVIANQLLRNSQQGYEATSAFEECPQR